MSFAGFAFPATQPVSHKPYVGLAIDELHNEIPAWDEPTPVMVISWRVTKTQSFSLDYRARGEYQSRQASEVVMCYPTDLAVGVRDIFTLGGVDYEVDEITDATHGFHGWAPGFSAKLKRITPKGRP